MTTTQTRPKAAQPAEDAGLPDSLHARKARVLAGVERIPKLGINKEQGYPFARESDIVDALRTLLAENGISLTVQMNDVQRWEITSAKGTRGTGMLVDLMFTLSTEKNEVETVRWMGESTDFGDKALLKAITAAKKSYLTNTFLISTGDDPEATPHVEHAPSMRDAAFAVSEGQSKRLFALAKQHEWGLDYRDVVKLATRIFTRTKAQPTGTDNPHRIPSKATYEKVSDFIEAGPDDAKVDALAKMQAKVDAAVMAEADAGEYGRPVAEAVAEMVKTKTPEPTDLPPDPDDADVPF
jgi:hypothetical protein